MCGISGIVELNHQKNPKIRSYLKVMEKIQKHRGPDGDGIWINEKGNVGLGHQRLSIIDLSTGAQPMNDDSGCCITYNGEIYNYLELREELSDYDFRTSSDTEVILKAYNKWGVNCVKKFRGMFSFAIWDPKKNRLFCSRDQFGIKPFYYTVVNNNFYFASEIKTLLPFAENIKLNFDGVKDYLSLQLLLNDKTLFENILPSCPVPTFKVIVLAEGASIIPLDEFPITMSTLFKKLKYIEDPIDL